MIKSHIFGFDNKIEFMQNQPLFLWKSLQMLDKNLKKKKKKLFLDGSVQVEFGTIIHELIQEEMLIINPEMHFWYIIKKEYVNYSIVIKHFLNKI